MSNTAALQPDFDFWEFVNCGRCQLPFALGATVPFWLTECGHILCNNHLNADQSCTQCGAHGVQLVPLQRELDDPMSEWFRPVPIALDSIAQAAKFQQETLASQVRYYRTVHQQHRALIERLKRETAEVKKVNEALDDENNQLRQLLGTPQQSGLRYNIQPSDMMNSNGKRPMISARLRPQTKSSPLAMLTPVGPDRLTRPPSQVAPNLLSNTREEHEDGPQNVHHDTRPMTQRPAGTLIEHYSYVPPSTPQFHPPQLTHTQAAPRLFQRTRPNQEHQYHAQAPQGPTPQAQRTVPPPAKFKPAKTTSASQNKPSSFNAGSQTRAHRQSGQQQGNMGPPPTPLHARQQQSADTASASESLVNTQPRTSHFVPPDRQSASLSAPVVQSQPPTPSIGTSQRFMPPGARISSRTTPFNMSGGNQRIPFVPGTR